MKLLIDQNLSPFLINTLIEFFPGSTHVQNIGLDSAKDTKIWEFAKSNNYIIVTKDADYAEKSLVDKHSPKIIWIRRGNCPTNDIELILKNNYQEIVTFYEDVNSRLLNLY